MSNNIKKLFVAIVAIVGLTALSGCSLIKQTAIENNTGSIQETTGLDNPRNIIATDSNAFDKSKIEFIVDDAAMESYYMYKDMNKVNDGSIGVRIGGNDGVGSDLLYIKNGKIEKEIKNIFWYNFNVDNNIHEYCNDDLNNCKVVKQTTCTRDGDKNENCIHAFFEYMFNLVNGTESSEYFTKKMEELTTNSNISIEPDVDNQLTRINKLFEKDGKLFGEFNYVQDGGICKTENGDEYVSGCYKDENTKIRIIEIDTNNGEFFVFENAPATKKISFDAWYNKEHPYTGVSPKDGKLDSIFIITVKDGKITKVAEDYTS